MKKLIVTFKKILQDVWLGFKIAEENRHKSQWGKW
jgi:hypothetical protein